MQKNVNASKSPAYIYLILTFMSMVFLLGSCSTTKVLTEDQTRLKSNVITVVNKKEHPEYQDSQLDNYIRQQANTYIIKTKRRMEPVHLCLQLDQRQGQGMGQVRDEAGAGSGGV